MKWKKAFKYFLLILIVYKITFVPKIFAYSSYTDLNTADASIVGANGEWFANSASAIGDINGDGYNDFVAASWESIINIYFGGPTSKWSMNMTSSQADASFYSTHTGQGLGTSYLFSSGDLNGDNIDDLVVAHADYKVGMNMPGKIFIVFGKTSGWSQNVDIDANSDASIIGQGNWQLSFSVKIVGDLNNDSFDDLLIGAYNQFPSRGFLFFGKNSGWSQNMQTSSADVTFEPENAATDFLGFTVSGLGDVNGDGIDDVLIGNRYNGVNGEGKVYVFFGRTSWNPIMNLSQSDASYIGEGSYDRLGYSGTGLGDVNGDNLNDFIVGAPYYNGAYSDVGKVYVIFGKTAGWVNNASIATSDASYFGTALNDLLGYFVYKLGDIDNDGFDDFGFGIASSSGNANARNGILYIVKGKEFGWPVNSNPGVVDIAYMGGNSSNLNFYLSQTQDINKDGISDLIISEQGYNPGSSPWTGRLLLFFGRQSNEVPDFSAAAALDSTSKVPGKQFKLTSIFTLENNKLAKKISFKNTIPIGLSIVSAKITQYLGDNIIYAVSSNSGNYDYDHLKKLSPVDLSVVGSIRITLSGYTVVSSTGLARNPISNEYYAVLQLPGRRFELVKLNMSTGVATDIGQIKHSGDQNGLNIANISFNQSGLLYGVTGDGDTNYPERLFTINLSNAQATSVLALGNGGSGEAIGFADDEFIYHFSGGWGDMIFEKINMNTLDITSIPLIGDISTVEAVQTLTYMGNDIFMVSSYPSDSCFKKISKQGVIDSGFEFCNADFVYKGIVVDAPQLPQTCSIIGQNIECYVPYVSNSNSGKSTYSVETMLAIPSNTAANSNFSLTSFLTSPYKLLNTQDDSISTSLIVTKPAVVASGTSKSNDNNTTETANMTDSATDDSEEAPQDDEVTEVESGYEITLIIKDKDGLLLANTEVSIEGKLYKTNSEGKLTLKNYKYGELTIEASGYIKSTFSLSVGDISKIVVISPDIKDKNFSYTCLLLLLLILLIIYKTYKYLRNKYKHVPQVS